MTYSGDDYSGFDWDEELGMIGMPPFRRHQIRRESVNIDGRKYEVPVLDTSVDYWGRLWRIGMIKPSPLWTLVSSQGGRRMRVCGPDGNDNALRCSDDPEHVWDAIFAYAATYDNHSCYVIVGCDEPEEDQDIIDVMPTWDVWEMSFDVQAWSDRLNACSDEELDEWVDARDEIRLAHKVAWQRVWPTKPEPGIVLPKGGSW